MKKIISIVSAFAFAVAALTSCDDSALTATYGDILIYMPQATHNLGTDNNLYVDVSADAVLKEPAKQTSVTLGVYRSSTAPKEAFSVDLVVVKDTLERAQAIAAAPGAPALYSIYDGSKFLDEKYHESLPGQIVVKNGERQGMVQLVLNDKAIVEDNAIGQVLCLPVRIVNPSKYTINEKLAFTMVVVRVKE